ncbi:MAP kinase kinase Wis1 [Thecaphora frezii]
MSNPTADFERMAANLNLDDPSSSSIPSPSSVQGPSRTNLPPSFSLPQQRPTGGPPMRSSPGPRPPGSGGPMPPRGGVAGLNERTRQMASTKLPPSLQAKLAANANRSASGGSSPSPGVLGHDQKIDSASLLGSAGGMGSLTPSLGLGSLAARRAMGAGVLPISAPVAPGLGMSGRRNRPGLKLSDMGISSSDGMGSASSGSAPTGLGGGRRAAPPGRLDSSGNSSNGSNNAMSSPFSSFSKIVDPSGRLNFSGKAVLHASGVEFGNGTSFQIKMEDLELMDELGKGNYGTVRKVRHTRTKVDMAMKEIRLELDDSKLNGIIMELDILHRATAPQIVDFYGAFFIESCVYYCMEFMDAGSLDKLYWGRATVPEDVLARITRSMVLGLSFLKDELQIIHRDVKPTNVLVNRKGQVKLCDFGVSGQLEKSLAKTNIGCQSYMAVSRMPRRFVVGRFGAATLTRIPLFFFPFLLYMCARAAAMGCGSDTTPDAYTSAGTHQGRIAKHAGHVYGGVGRVVVGPVDCRDDAGHLPLPARDVQQRICTAAGHRPRRSAGAAGGGILGYGQGFRGEMPRKGARPETDVRPAAAGRVFGAGRGKGRRRGGYGSMGREGVGREVEEEAGEGGDGFFVVRGGGRGFWGERRRGQGGRGRRTDT